MNKYLKLSLFSAAGIVTIGLVSSILTEKESKSSEVAQIGVLTTGYSPKPMKDETSKPQSGQPPATSSSLTQEDIDMLSGKKPIPEASEETGKEDSSSDASFSSY
jgi:hypothetical protein